MSIVQLIALPILTIAWASASFGYAAATAANVNPANGRAYGTRYAEGPCCAADPLTMPAMTPRTAFAQ
jgi:hypothetical protein